MKNKKNRTIYTQSILIFSVAFSVSAIFSFLAFALMTLVGIVGVAVLSGGMALGAVWLARTRGASFCGKYRAGVNKTLHNFRLAVDAASDHIVITDNDGIILYANRAAERITGYSIKEMLGKKAGGKELWGGHMGKEFYKKLWHTVKEKKQVFRGEVKNIRKDGEEYTASVSIAPVLDKRGDTEFFVGIERDITKEKEMEWVKTEFVSLASHQLRTPITAIGWNVEMLLEEDSQSLTARQKRFLEAIDRGRGIMLKLVNTLLNISRLELGVFEARPESVDIALAIRNCVSDAQELARDRNVSFRINVSNAIGEIMIDPTLFAIVLDNVITNAVKYSNPGGMVDIGATKKGGDLIINVRDEGIGIPKNQQSRVFEKSFRAENAKRNDSEGNGLGLYMARKIVERCGGSIRFSSRENQETVFTIVVTEDGCRNQKDMKRKEN